MRHWHMENISKAYAELINLQNLAKFHRERCADSDCGVMLYSLKDTARRLIPHVWPQEKKAAIEILESTTWI